MRRDGSWDLLISRSSVVVSSTGVKGVEKPGARVGSCIRAPGRPAYLFFHVRRAPGSASPAAGHCRPRPQGGGVSVRLFPGGSQADCPEVKSST